MQYPTWEYEAPEVCKTYRAATRFFAKLDEIPVWQVAKYLGSVSENALVDYVRAVLNVSPQYFNRAVYDRAERARHILYLGEDQPLIFPSDPHWTWKIKYTYLYGGEIHVQTPSNEFDTRTQALFGGIFSFGLASRSQLAPFRAPRLHPEPQGEYLLRKEIKLAEFRECLNVLNGNPSEETVEEWEAREAERKSNLQEARLRHSEGESLFKLADLLERLKELKK